MYLHRFVQVDSVLLGMRAQLGLDVVPVLVLDVGDAVDAVLDAQAVPLRVGHDAHPQNAFLVIACHQVDQCLAFLQTQLLLRGILYGKRNEGVSLPFEADASGHFDQHVHGSDFLPP